MMMQNWSDAPRGSLHLILYLICWDEDIFTKWHSNGSHHLVILRQLQVHIEGFLGKAKEEFIMFTWMSFVVECCYAMQAQNAHTYLFHHCQHNCQFVEQGSICIKSIIEYSVPLKYHHQPSVKTPWMLRKRPRGRFIGAMFINVSWMLTKRLVQQIFIFSCDAK